MLRSISSEELTEWAAYDRIDPFGSYRDDLRMGITVSQLLAPHLKKGAGPLKPTDFMPTFGEAAQPKAMSPTEIHARMDLFMSRARRSSAGV